MVKIRVNNESAIKIWMFVEVLNLTFIRGKRRVDCYKFLIESYSASHGTILKFLTFFKQTVL